MRTEVRSSHFALRPFPVTLRPWHSAARRSSFPVPPSSISGSPLPAVGMDSTDASRATCDRGAPPSPAASVAPPIGPIGSRPSQAVPLIVRPAAPPRTSSHRSDSSHRSQAVPLMAKPPLPQTSSHPSHRSHPSQAQYLTPQAFSDDINVAPAQFDSTFRSAMVDRTPENSPGDSVIGAIVYVYDKGELLVLAVMHMSRHPDSWKDRS